MKLDSAAEECLYARNNTIPIKGFRSITITVKAPEGPRQIILTKVALVPSFHTSVVSLDRFIEKNVHWDTEKSRLTFHDHTFCAVERHHRQWVLEYNKPLETAVF